MPSGQPERNPLTRGEEVTTERPRENIQTGGSVSKKKIDGKGEKGPKRFTTIR